MNTLHFTPCLPAHWKTFTVHYRHYETVYHIKATYSSSPDDTMIVTLDGALQPSSVIPLTNDHKEHVVDVRIGKGRLVKV